MTEPQNRTLICSVLFLDIVGYSQKAVAEQIALKDRLNTLLSEALRGVALNDRIILDTGDGAAISFIGDPEDALYVATALRDAIRAQAASGLSTRMGINVGPVRLVKDINGRPNVIGDGINVAQRVMTFAAPGQVLVSRSYYEVVSRLAEESARLFSSEGARTDKDKREHEVYAVGAGQPARRRAEPDADVRRETPAPPPPVPGTATQSVRAVARSIAARPPLATTLAVASILMVALVVRASREPPDIASAEAPPSVPQASLEEAKPPRQPQPERRADAAPASSTPIKRSAEPVAQPAEKAVPPVPDKTTGRAVPENAKTQAPETATAPVAAQKAKPQVAEKAQTAASEKARTQGSEKPKTQAQEKAKTQLAQAKTAQAGASSADARAVGQTSSGTREATVESKAASVAPAMVSFAIAPWGEVHVNGKMQGVSPPLKELQLAPGKHRIELRNTGAKPHVVNVDAKPGERIRIKHKFK